MKEYYKRNRAKIFFAAKGCTIVFGMFSLLLTAIATYYDKTAFTDMLFYSIIFVTGITLFILVLGITTGYYKFYCKRLLFNEPVFRDFFIENHFSIIDKYATNRWYFSEEVMKGKIRNFEVVSDFCNNKRKWLRFDFLITKIPINNQRYDQLSKLFENYQATFDFDTIYLLIDITKPNSIHNTINQLNLFADVLTKEGFIPAPTNK